MSLLDEARSLGIERPRCSVGTYLESLGPGERAELEEALSAPIHGVGVVHSTKIVEAMSKRGWKDMPPSNTVSRHRRGDCKCRS